EREELESLIRAAFNEFERRAPLDESTRAFLATRAPNIVVELITRQLQRSVVDAHLRSKTGDVDSRRYADNLSAYLVSIAEREVQLIAASIRAGAVRSKPEKVDELGSRRVF